MSNKRLQQQVDALEKQFDRHRDAVMVFAESVRSKLKLTGTADPYTCCVCGQPAAGGYGTALGARIGYCRLHWPETATEATMQEELDRHLRRQVECRALYNWLNGKTDKEPPIADRILEKLSKTPRQCTCVSGVVGDDCPLHKHLAPDLPLHARVAKANGKDVKYLEGVGWGKDGWYYWNPRAHDGARWLPVSDYFNDLVAAMGALEEYAEKNCSIYIIRRNRAKDYQIVLYPPMTSDTAGWYDGIALPQAICEAICNHHRKGKK